MFGKSSVRAARLDDKKYDFLKANMKEMDNIKSGIADSASIRELKLSLLSTVEEMVRNAERLHPLSPSQLLLLDITQNYIYKNKMNEFKFLSSLLSRYPMLSEHKFQLLSHKYSLRLELQETRQLTRLIKKVNNELLKKLHPIAYQKKVRHIATTAGIITAAAAVTFVGVYTGYRLFAAKSKLNSTLITSSNSMLITSPTPTL